MRFILNVIWLVFGGLLMALGYLLAGVIMCILIVTIPFGIAAFRLGGYALWPFGRVVVRKADARGGSIVGNIIWGVLAGWWIALGHIISAILCFITIIGIPFGIAHLKLAKICFIPFGTMVVDKKAAEAAVVLVERLTVSPAVP